jgi:hypothetical protein
MKSPIPALERAAWAAFAAFLACACVSAGDELRQGQDTQASVFTNPPGQESSEAPRLYARDGTLVAGPADASQPAGPHSRELGDGSGRMVLLELYQNVIEERDALSLEVSALRAELEKVRSTQKSAEAEALSQVSRVEALEAERAKLAADALEMAGRLTTAQIRRLQAEKLLLEHKLEAQRARVASAQGEARS